MKPPRQVFAPLLAAVALVVTAAPSVPAPDTSGWSWQPMYFSGVASPSVSVANDEVRVLKVVGDDLYVGGSFTGFAGGSDRNRIARWNSVDEEWHDLGGSEASGAITSGTVLSIEVSGNYVYVGGDFTITDASAEVHHNFAYFDLLLQEWHGFDGATTGDLFMNGEVRTIFADENTDALYVGGNFTNAHDNNNADYLVVGSFSGCVGVVGACVTETPHVSVCGGVSVSCAISVPNRWDAVGDDGAGGPALSGFVSSITGLASGSLLISGNFGNAGGTEGANSITRLTYTDRYTWASEVIPSVSMYPLAMHESTAYVGGWEDVYQRDLTGSWLPICYGGLHRPGGKWDAVEPVSRSLVFAGSSAGLFACNPETGGSSVFYSSGWIADIVRFHDDLIVAGSSNLGELGSVGDYIAIVRGVDFTDLPATDADRRSTTERAILLVSLAALTALAGTQLLKRS